MGNKYIIIIVLIILATSLVAIWINAPFIEISNNVTLVVEVGIGIIIAIIIYAISRKSEEHIEQKIIRMSEVVNKQEKNREERETSMQRGLLVEFKNIEKIRSRILSDSADYNKTNDASRKLEYKKHIISDYQRLCALSKKNIDDSITALSEFFDYDEIGTLKTISNICKINPNFDKYNKVTNISHYNNLEYLIQTCIDELSNKLEAKTENIPANPKADTIEYSGSITVSSDRSVYPLDSIIHVRANLNSVTKGEMINYEITNSKGKILVSQTLNPATYDDPNLAGSNIFQVDFKMKGKEWVVGDEYFVRAIHDSLYAEYSFVIDQRVPIIQADKSEYTMNSDMILTVIDPDADKDNQVTEYVGDREDSKLIIESPYGRIDGYKLRETGESTGIFQGIVGILGMRNDGTVIENNFGGKIIDKIQGTGIDDGFIGGSPGQKITISYRNKTDTIKLSILVSNLGAKVELDKT